LARRWYDKAVTWMDKNKTQAEALRRYRAEAEKLLGSPKRRDPRRRNRSMVTAFELNSTPPGRVGSGMKIEANQRPARWQQVRARTAQACSGLHY